MPKRKNMSDPELLWGWNAWGGLYCCVKRGIVRCFQLMCPCGGEACPGGGGPFARRLGASRRFFPLPAGFDSWNLVPTQGDLTTRTEQVRLMVQTVPQYRLSSWGEGVAQSTGGWWGRPHEYAAILQGSKALNTCSVLSRAAQDHPFQWNATFIEVPFAPELHPRGLNPGCAEIPSTSLWRLKQPSSPVLGGCLVPLSDFSITDDGS